MERSCNCCAYHSYNHSRDNYRYEHATSPLSTQESPSPAWPLVVLCVVFVLLVGPVVVDPPEEIVSVRKIGGMCVLLPFLLLLAFHFFLSQPQWENHEGGTLHRTDRASYGSAARTSTSGYNHSPSHHSATVAEEPLYGWGLFLLFLVAVILLSFT